MFAINNVDTLDTANWKMPSSYRPHQNAFQSGYLNGHCKTGKPTHTQSIIEINSTKNLKCIGLPRKDFLFKESFETKAYRILYSIYLVRNKFIQFKMNHNINFISETTIRGFLNHIDD